METLKQMKIMSDGVEHTIYYGIDADIGLHTETLLPLVR